MTEDEDEYQTQVEAITCAQLREVIDNFPHDTPVFLLAGPDSMPVSFEVGEMTIQGGPADGKRSLVFRVVA